jgi:Animal haem peroxidase
MQRRHGDTKYYLVGNEILLPTPDLKESIRIAVSPDLPRLLEAHGIAADRVGIDAEKLFRYNYLFRHPRLPAYYPDDKQLTALGLSMGQNQKPEPRSRIPAGYTFLGQFIDHDLSFDGEKLSLGTSHSLETNKRSPSLDLDSLYGLDLENVKASEAGKYIYEADGIKLRLGLTQEDIAVHLPNAEKKFPHDLFRGWNADKRLAALVDPRNDENLGVAQTHVAFIKFHNAVVDFLAKATPAEELFDKAREEVVRRYQWIILDDYLPRITERSVLTDVTKNPSKHFILSSGEPAFMPVEFSVAAFRLGHSMITATYEWNRAFQSAGPKPQVATLRDLFIFTGAGGFRAQEHLVSSWIIDWTRFYDFSHIPGTQINSPTSLAGKIDPSLVSDLMTLRTLPTLPDIQGSESLAVRNLLRGRMLGLPAGQTIADFLHVPFLEPTDFKDEPQYEMLQSFGFDRLTPLWYYILKEAKVFHPEGGCLGPVGSRIVAETFVGLIRASKISILPPDGPAWKPPKKFGMAEMLSFVNNASPDRNFLNPLG